MTPDEEIVRLRAEEEREKLAISSRERAMEAEERELERAMRAFEEDADQAKRYIKSEWRREHWGRDPARPAEWDAQENTSSRTRRRRDSN
jgi:hypothetical protein